MPLLTVAMLVTMHSSSTNNFCKEQYWRGHQIAYKYEPRYKV